MYIDYTIWSKYKTIMIIWTQTCQLYYLIQCFTIAMIHFISLFLKTLNTKPNLQTSFTKTSDPSGKIKQSPKKHFICGKNQTMVSDHTHSCINAPILSLRSVNCWYQHSTHLCLPCTLNWLML